MATAAPKTLGFVSIYPSGPYLGSGWASCATPITWYVDTGELTGTLTTAAITNLRYALRIWGKAAHTSVTEGGVIALTFDDANTIAHPIGVQQGDRKIYVKFVNNTESTYLSGRVMGAASPTSISPLSDEIVGGSAVFRTDYLQHATNRAVLALFLHELGHVFGLGHSSNPKSVMYASVSNTINLSASDITGINQLSKPCPASL